MDSIGFGIFTFWLLWCLSNLAIMFFVAPRGPAFTGFRIVMPEYLKQILSKAEYDAILAHEQGHKHHRHVWENYARACFFHFTSKGRRREQEMEADDYAANRGHAVALASALRKLSMNKFDHLRARRLLGERDGMV